MARTAKFATCMMDYFGKLPGQSLQQFMEELRQLNDADKAWFRENLAKVGYIVEA
jgi:hypothetical protein